ncbi:MAG: trypsin-like peptidase domain-containing protein [Opitutaceae bacterium]|nr:trypsin-like peptidase domain-containing protein [Opitutaceae bacterium]
MLKDYPGASTTLPGDPAAGRRRGVGRLVAVGLVAALGLAGCMAPGPGAPTGAAGSATASTGLKRGFENLLQAVVRIDVREMTFDAGATRLSSGVGSGVILSADGLVLTNAHVVSPRAVEVSVTLPSLERVGATLVGWDHWTDLALLRIDMADARRRGLAFSVARFGDSERLAPGQTVFAVGTPHGLTRTVTKGIISNTDRYFEASDGVRGYETGYFSTWLQTDAAINPGNSGGPLVTEDGAVVGINSRTYLGAENLGFAIPSNTARLVMQQLVQKGEVERSYIGLIPGALRDLESFFELAINTGMLVNSVDPGSPAARAGLRPGDIVLAINGEAVDGRFPEQLPPIQNRIASFAVGTSVVLSVKRNGSTPQDVVVVTERLESRVGEEWAFERWGMSVRKVSRAYARENRLPDEDGVIVIGTQPAFPAEKAGLSRGDIITKVKGETVRTLEQLKELYAAFERAPESILIEATRNRAVSLVVLKP